MSPHHRNPANRTATDSRTNATPILAAFVLAIACSGSTTRRAHAEGCLPGDTLSAYSGAISSGVGPSDASFRTDSGNVCIRIPSEEDRRNFTNTIEIYDPADPQREGLLNPDQLATSPPAASVRARSPASTNASADEETALTDVSTDADFIGQVGAACTQVHLPDPLSDVLHPPSAEEETSPGGEKGPDPAVGDNPLKPRIPPLALPRGLDAFRQPELRHLLEQKAEEERRDAFVNSVIEAQQAVQQAAADDDRGLRDRYRGLSAAELSQRLDRAQERLANQTKALESAQSGLFPGERLRFQNTFQNARDKSAAARELLREAQPLEEGSETPPLLEQFANVFNPTHHGGSNAAVQSAAVASLLGSGDPSSSDGLANRVLLLNGLPDKDREEATSKLNLVEQPQLTLNDGTSVQITIPHNGYILGGGKTGLDCSSFVSSALPVDVRKSRFTTLDFHAMWVFRRYGKLPRPPVYPKAREELLTETAMAFTALDLYEGDAPGPGDLLVYRTPSQEIGHVFVVRNYDGATRVARVIEAAQSAGTVRERDFPLTLEPASRGTGRVFIRPGLKLLRLRPVHQKVCRFERLDAKPSSGRVPAGTPPPSESEPDDFCTGARAC